PVRRRGGNGLPPGNGEDRLPGGHAAGRRPDSFHVRSVVPSRGSRRAARGAGVTRDKQDRATGRRVPPGGARGSSRHVGSPHPPRGDPEGGSSGPPGGSSDLLVLPPRPSGVGRRPGSRPRLEGRPGSRGIDLGNGRDVGGIGSPGRSRAGG